MINQIIVRVSSDHEYDLIRHFPGKGKAAVKVGDIVSAADIVAHCEVSAGQRLIKIAHALGVRASSVSKYLLRNIGDRIYEGETVARKRGVLGLGKKEIHSPADGVITNIDPNGDIIVKFLPISVRVTAGAGGKVKKIEENAVTIATVATQVSGPVASGKERDGTIKVVAGQNEFLLPQHINADCAGKIVVGGALLERATLEKALTIGVHGIVCGGINHRDFLSLGVSSDVGLTVLITEGYGTFPLGQDIYEALKALEGRFAFLSGEEARLLIPELNPKVEGASASPKLGWRELKKGDTVRIVHEKKEKLIGKIKELKESETLQSGLQSEVAIIDLGNSLEISVAAANLQILEN